jgi:hypothetical protein
VLNERLQNISHFAAKYLTAHVRILELPEVVGAFFRGSDHVMNQLPHCLRLGQELEQAVVAGLDFLQQLGFLEELF